MALLGNLAKGLYGGALQAIGEIPGVPNRGQIKSVGENITNPAVNIYGKLNPATFGSGVPLAPPYRTGGGAAPGGQAPAGQSGGGGGYDFYGGGLAAPAGLDAATMASYNQAIANTQAAFDRQGSLLNSGYGGIESSYQNALNQLLLGKNQANSAYATNKQATAKEYVGAKNTIGSQAGASLNGLMRLLGARGVSGSPVNASRQAVARGATLQRGDVGNTFGANNQALDTNWGNFMTGYNNEVSSAGNQRQQQRQGLESSIDSNKASLLQSLAQLVSARDGGTASAQPYLNQANSLLDRTANYTTAPINYQTQAYEAPSLASYTTAPNATPTFQGSPGGSDYFSPYLQALLGKKQPRLA